MSQHKAIHLSHTTLFIISRRRDVCRYWFNANGELVGLWKTKRTNKIYAVGHNPKGEVIFYRTCAVA